MAALIRPLARIAGPGEGLVLDLPKRLLDEEFGAGAIMRFEDVDFPPALVPGRPSLPAGLPEDSLLQLDTEVPCRPSPTLADQRPSSSSADEDYADGPPLITASLLIEDTSLVVDSAAAAVLRLSVPTHASPCAPSTPTSPPSPPPSGCREEGPQGKPRPHRLLRTAGRDHGPDLATVDPMACDPTPTLKGDDGWRYWRMFETAGGTLHG